MDAIGINFNLLLMQIILAMVLIGFPIISLIDLARKKLGGAALGIWALIICTVPVVGPLAYWLIKPSLETK